ncbi:hypothetical protein DICVIV_12927 [Dictyocaulus viviparus]|uniref:Uncharacterized protein n=1 Tax=Dictyocaulus viviparus TaxID=29172 RepID=A0A0D8XBF7_DICVI|nr:hypothetical protein DICVIV_12927 [Dictyocaulus viviparus]
MAIIMMQQIMVIMNLLIIHSLTILWFFLNYIDKWGCKAAVLSCDYRKGLAALQTLNGEILAAGKSFQAHVKCRNKKKWVTRDINNNDVHFRTVRCLMKKSLSGYK